MNERMKRFFVHFDKRNDCGRRRLATARKSIFVCDLDLNEDGGAKEMLALKIQDGKVKKR